MAARVLALCRSGADPNRARAFPLSPPVLCHIHCLPSSSSQSLANNGVSTIKRCWISIHGSMCRHLTGFCNKCSRDLYSLVEWGKSGSNICLLLRCRTVSNDMSNCEHGWGFEANSYRSGVYSLSQRWYYRWRVHTLAVLYFFSFRKFIICISEMRV